MIIASCTLSVEQHVLGVDLSEKMLALAQHQHAHPAIRYQRLAMEDISRLQGRSGQFFGLPLCGQLPCVGGGHLPIVSTG